MLRNLPGALALSLLAIACGQGASDSTVQPPSEDVRRYWFQNKAEITSYRLEQARYGEIRRGHAVTIFVTEEFSRSQHVKLDQPQTAGDDLSVVLKLNLTKNFQTGIYPYSMMMSTFTPVAIGERPAIWKLSVSSQEWCGHTFTQLNAADDRWRARIYSYFQSEGDSDRQIARDWLEDEFWTRIRLNPESLPEGRLRVISSVFSHRLRHRPLEALDAVARLEREADISSYRLEYENDQRSLVIQFSSAFPHDIVGWEETYPDGFRDPAPALTTRATRLKSTLSDYWRRNANADEVLYRELGL